MIKKIINTKYNKEREEKIEMKNLMNKLSKILLVLFMFLTSTIQVHAEPGGGMIDVQLSAYQDEVTGKIIIEPAGEGADNYGFLSNLSGWSLGERNEGLIYFEGENKNAEFDREQNKVIIEPNQFTMPEGQYTLCLWARNYGNVVIDFELKKSFNILDAAIRGFTFEYDATTDNYKITETSGKLNLPEGPKSLQLQFYSSNDKYNDEDGYYLYNIDSTDNGVYIIEKTDFKISKMLYDGEYHVYLKVMSYDTWEETLYYISSDNENGKAKMVTPFNSVPEGSKVEVVDEGLLITTTNPTSAESKKWFDSILENWNRTSLYVAHDGNSVQITDSLTKLSDKGLLLSYENIKKFGIPKTTVSVMISTPAYFSFDSEDVELKDGAVSSNDIEIIEAYRDSETHDVIIKVDPSDAKAVDYLKNVYFYELHCDGSLYGYDFIGEVEVTNGTIVLPASLFDWADAVCTLYLKSYNYSSKLIGEIDFTAPKNNFSLNYENNGEVYNLTVYNPDAFEYTPDSRYYLHFYGNCFMDDEGNIQYDNHYGQFEVRLQKDGERYFFTSDNIIKQSGRLDTNKYYVSLSIDNNEFEYNLTSEPIYFKEIERALYEENEYFRDDLELIFEEDRYIIQTKNGSDINLSQGTYEFDFYSPGDEIFGFNIMLHENGSNSLYFTTDDFELRYFDILKANNYRLVLRSEGEFALNYTPIYFPQVGAERIDINRIPSEYKATLEDNGDGTFTIIPEDSLPGYQYEILFAKDDEIKDDSMYYNYGKYAIDKFIQNEKGLVFSSQDYNNAGTEEYTPAGNYLPYLCYWDVDNYLNFIPLTDGEEMYFDQSHKSVPEGAKAVNVDGGVLITTDDPQSVESKAWFKAMEHLNDNQQLTSYYEIGIVRLSEWPENYEFRDDGLFIKKDLITSSGVVSGKQRIHISVSGYQSFFTYLNIDSDCIDTKYFEMNIYQDEETLDLILESDNEDYLRSMNYIFTSNTSASIHLIDDNNANGNATLEKVEDNLYRLRLSYSAFSDWPREDKNQGIVYNFLAFHANGYNTKWFDFNFKLMTDLKVNGKPQFIITSKGLILRSKDKEYLEALYNSNNQGTVNISFYNKKNNITINSNESIFTKVEKYKNKEEYYTRINADILKKYLETDQLYEIYIESEDVDYTNYSPGSVQFDLTTIFKIYDQVNEYNENDLLFDKEQLEDLDEDINGLSNVTVNTTTTNEYDEDITIDGIITGAVITDNEGGIDEETLAFEDKENIDINVNVEEAEDDATNETFDTYQIIVVNKSFDVNVTRNVDNGGNENIIELPLYVMVEIGDCELEEGNELKILKTHTDSNGQTSQELLDVYYNQETQKYYFYTNQFSNFQVVQVKEKDDEEEVKPSEPGTTIPEPEINTEVEKLPVIDPTKPVEEVTVGTTEASKEVINETVKEIIENIKENNKVTNVSEELVESIVNEIENGNDVDLVTEVVIKSIDEKEVTKETIQLIVETVKGSEVAQYLDLSVLLSVIVNDEVIATSEITELSKPMTFTIVIPEELAKLEEGFTRTYYVVREHNGVAEKLPVTVNSDGTLTFSTDKFSTYALVYVDTKVEDVKPEVKPEDKPEVTPEIKPEVTPEVKPEEKPEVKPEVKPEEKPETPETGDNSHVMVYAFIALLSLAVILVLKKKEELSK